MTIQKKNTDLNHYESLRQADFTKGKLKAVIHEKPRIVKTRFREDQPLIVLRLGVEKKNWWANWESMNGLIDKFGNEESWMVEKTIELEIREIEVNGELRDGMFLKDSNKKSKRG